MNKKTDDIDINSLKKMVRLLEWKRRAFLENDWKEHPCPLAKSQFNQLMLIRFVLPCNLGRIMSVTGLTSAGASLFVDKLVQSGWLARKDNPSDRRNILISLTAQAQQALKQVDDRLDDYILNYLTGCSQNELTSISDAMEIICRKLEEKPDSGC